MTRLTEKLGGGVLLAGLIGVLAACHTPTDPGPIARGDHDARPEAFIVKPDFLVLLVGDSYTLHTNGAGDKVPGWNPEVSWASLNPEVAVVSGPGRVIALAEGETFIIAETGDGITADVAVAVFLDAEAIPGALRQFWLKE
jgi:hypothetical protein